MGIFCYYKLFITLIYVWYFGTVTSYEFEMSCKVSLAWIFVLGHSLGLVHVSGIDLVYTELASGVAHIFLYFITNLPKIHPVVVYLLVNIVPFEAQFLVNWIEPRNFHMFICIVKYGYKDLHKRDENLENLFDTLFTFVWLESMMECCFDSEVHSMCHELKNMTSYKDGFTILSAFGLDHVKGFIFVEADRSRNPTQYNCWSSISKVVDDNRESSTTLLWLNLTHAQAVAMLSYLSSRKCCHELSTKLNWTGKTKLLASLMWSLVERKCKMLICVPTNVVMVHITLRLLAMLQETITFVSSFGIVVLFGNKEKLKIQKLGLKTIYLNHVCQFSNCCAPLLGWNNQLKEMIAFFENSYCGYFSYWANFNTIQWKFYANPNRERQKDNGEQVKQKKWVQRKSVDGGKDCSTTTIYHSIEDEMTQKTFKVYIGTWVCMTTFTYKGDLVKVVDSYNEKKE